jgi:predicted dehydrogenase
MKEKNNKFSSRKQVHRRGFLKTAGAASLGAMFFPEIVRASAKGANDRITLGLIGMGHMMSGHLNGLLARDNVQIVAMCDVESVRLGFYKNKAEEHYAARRGQAAYKGVNTCGDFRKVVARRDIDAVMIATPDHWHVLQAMAMVESGKDVYCEKPLTLTINEGKALVRAVRRTGQVFQTGSQQRSSNEFRLACELVRNKRIGELKEVIVNVGGPSKPCDLPPEPVPETLDWNMWLGPAPWRPYNSDIAPHFDLEAAQLGGNPFGGWANFRAYRDYSGGLMTDWGAHHFDIAQWGTGMDSSGPVEIIPPDGKDVKHLTYYYANGVKMQRRSASHGVVFIGTEGRVMVSRGQIDSDPASILEEPIGPNDIHLYESPGHHDDWLNSIRTRSRPICDVEIGHRSATVCHLGNIAYWLNRPLRWDPEKEEIINDPGAGRLLQRAMRSPWSL